MPFASPYDRSALKALIVARVAKGETVAGICDEAGMPCKEAVQVWRQADASFREALAAARRRGDWLRRLAFDEAVAEAFLKRVRAGERIRDLLDKPGMPSQRTYRFWRRTQGAFQAELFQRINFVASRNELPRAVIGAQRRPSGGVERLRNDLENTHQPTSQ